MLVLLSELDSAEDVTELEHCLTTLLERLVNFKQVLELQCYLLVKFLLYYERDIYFFLLFVVADMKWLLFSETTLPVFVELVRVYEEDRPRRVRADSSEAI